MKESLKRRSGGAIHLAPDDAIFASSHIISCSERGAAARFWTSRWPHPSRGLSPGGSGAAAKVTEEIAVGRNDHGRVIALHRGQIGAHRAIEGKEFRVLVESQRENPVFLRIA